MCEIQSRNAVANGASKLFALEPETGKTLKTIKLPGEPLVEIACNRTRGLIYGIGASGEVVSVDPVSGKVTATLTADDERAIASRGLAFFSA